MLLVLDVIKLKRMKIKLSTGKEIDTESDCGPEERHILQKLFGYKIMVQSIEEFREKKDKAFSIGWNDSGPVRETETLSLIAQQIEKEIAERLLRGESS